MKTRTLIPPVTAVIIVAAWAGWQRGAIADYKSDIISLKETITSTRASLADASSPAGKPRREREAPQDGPIDWIAILKQQSEQSQGVGNMRTMLRLQQRISQWTTDEILAALDDIKALDIGEEQRLGLEQMLIGPLGEKDPALTMETFAHRIQDMGGWILTGTMNSWLKKDPTAAIAWFDQAIAAGDFDSKALEPEGRNGARLQFEATVVSTLLDSNPAAASDRIASLPTTSRLEILGRIANELKNPADYVTLVRDSLDTEDEINQAITSASTTLAQRDTYEKASEFLQQASLSPEAYSKAIQDTAIRRIQNTSWSKPVTPEAIDEMRAWVSTEAPGTEDTVTGKALADATKHSTETKFDDAVAMITRFQQSSGSDDALVAFIETSRQGQHDGKLRALIENVTDPEQRRILLEKFE